jgi:hypothetical protein
MWTEDDDHARNIATRLPGKPATKYTTIVHIHQTYPGGLKQINESCTPDTFH